MTDARTPHEVLHPSNWKKASGYANGILTEGKVVWIGGQIGWTGDQIFEASDLVGQTQQALLNIVAIAREAGARPEHIVRMTWYITDKQDYLANLKGIGEAYRSVMG